MNEDNANNTTRKQRDGSMNGEVSLADIFRQSFSFLRRHAVRILVLGFVCASLMILAVQRMERLYKSSAQLLIERPATNPIEAENPTFPTTGTSYVDSQILLIEADDTLIKVVRDADLTSEPFFQSQPPGLLTKGIRALKSVLLARDEKEKALPEGAPDRPTLNAKNKLSEALTVSREGDTNVITIDVRANSPSLSRRVAEAVAATYVELRLDQRREDARQISKWIDARAEELRHEVSRAEKAVTDFRVKHGLIGEAGGATLSNQQMTELNAELVAANANLAMKQAALDRARTLQQQDGDILNLPEVQNSEILTELRLQLLEIELRERDLSATSGSNNSRLQQVREQKAAIERQVDAQLERMISVLANEVETAENRVQLLTNALSLAGGQSTIEIRNNVDLQQLERVAEAYRIRYERYLNNAGLAEEITSFTTSGTQVVTSATVPLEPVYPPVKVFVILSFLLGNIAGILWGLAREALDTTFKTSAQVESVLGLKVLVQLPKLTKTQRIPDIIEQEPLAPYTERIAALRYSLRNNRSADSLAPVICLASTTPQEGKSSIAAAMATSGNVAGQRILLIDGDLRRAGLSAQFGLEDEVGLADILQGSEWKSGASGSDGVLDVLPAGILTDMPINALESPRLGEFLDQARRDYDMIIIDGPPAANAADSAILSQNSDKVVFVVRWGQTEFAAAERSLTRLSRRKIVGVVMNFSELDDDPWLGETYRLYDRPHATAKKTRAGKVTSIADWGRRA